MNVALSLPSLGIHDVAIETLAGEETLGSPHRFEVSFVRGGDPLASSLVVGAAAKLSLGERTVGGVVATCTSFSRSGRAGHRLTIRPRAWLLSLSKRSRSFEQMSTPDIVAAVVAASGLGLELQVRLRSEYPRRAWTVQHRESDLDFVLRLLERDGITAELCDDGQHCSFSLIDENQQLSRQAALHDIDDVREQSQLLPQRLQLFASDPARPDLPLRATAEVSTTGVGELEIHDEPFLHPEEGDHVARLCAERLRCGANILEGNAGDAICPGRTSLGKSELVVTSVQHSFANGRWTSAFASIPAAVPFRPQRRAPEPKVLGLSTGQIAPAPPGSRAPDLRVRERAGDATDRAMASALGHGVELGEGTQVMWGCLDGDPARPVITSLLPDRHGDGSAQRLVMRAPSGATIELAGAAAPSFGVTHGSLADAHSRGRADIPSVAHHATLNTGSSNTVTDDASTTNEDGSTTNVPDTYVRFAVPHSKGWSYVRIGDTAGDLTGLSESGKYGDIKRDGYADTLGLDWEGNGPGLFDYTDGSRTQITQGDWEEVVKGKGRLAVHGGNDDPAYEMVVTSSKTYIQSNNPEWTYNTGAALDYFGGLKCGLVTGITLDVFLGGKASVDVGFQVDLTAGNKISFVFADSYEVRKGEELGLASTVDRRATDKIQFSILEKGTAGTEMDKWYLITGLMAAAGGIASAALGECSTQFEDGDEISAGVTAGIGAALAIAWGVIRAKSAERDLLDGNPIMSIDKGDTTAAPPRPALAALRSDDWLLLLSKDFAVLGKNKKWGMVAAADVEPAVTNLTMADAGTALVIEEADKLSLQSNKIKDAIITVEKDKIVIKAKTDVTIEAPTINLKGDVTITGKLKVTDVATYDKTLKVGTAHTFDP